MTRPSAFTMPIMANAEEVTVDGFRISEPYQDLSYLLLVFERYNSECFDGKLPHVPVYWATITQPDGDEVNGIYVHEQNDEGEKNTSP